jgi:hypothetical protein
MGSYQTGDGLNFTGAEAHIVKLLLCNFCTFLYMFHSLIEVLWGDGSGLFYVGNTPPCVQMKTSGKAMTVLTVDHRFAAQEPNLGFHEN